MKKLLQLKLKILAKLVLAKYQPKVIGITGSVGKTSAKNAIVLVLSKKFRVNKSIKNYNNEIGLPLSILGLETAGSSIIGWLKIFWRAIKMLLITDKNYPEILVLEMGIDRPGDMDYLNSIVKCDIGVMTAIGASHLEFFKNIEQTRKEKTKLLNNLKTGGVAVLNVDDEEVRKIILDYENKVSLKGVRPLAKGSDPFQTFGLATTADFQATDVVFDLTNKLGIDFKVKHNNIVKQMFLSGTIGYPAIYSVLSAVVVGVNLGLSLNDIDLALKNYQPTAGRMRIIKGINDSIIIDDTYNGSPQSALEALKAIKDLSNRKIAILGDMLELGDYTKSGHEEVGRYAGEIGVDLLVAVGEFGKHLIAGAKQSGMSENNILSFKNSIEATEKIAEQVKTGDVVVIKGSQGARMERVSKVLMKDKNLAGELLVRQDGSWI